MEKTRYRNLTQNKAGGFYFARASREGICLINRIHSQLQVSTRNAESKDNYMHIPRNTRRKGEGKML